jgi:hypothetical protein
MQEEAQRHQVPLKPGGCFVNTRASLHFHKHRATLSAAGCPSDKTSPAVAHAPVQLPRARHIFVAVDHDGCAPRQVHYCAKVSQFGACC